ncbi:MAG: NUDIX domain-containing protein [Bdellovibrionales bacterium]|nr:NUDIX domain-containing protein [Bdellovibrionales bacterium]
MRSQYFKLAKPITMGVAAIVFNADKQVLLVRLSYRDGWHLPGGGVNRGETIFHAMQRELREETGLRAQFEPEHLRGIFYHRIDGKHDHVSLFIADHWHGEPCANDPMEIVELKFFSIEALPDDTPDPVKKQIASFLAGEKPEQYW